MRNQDKPKQQLHPQRLQKALPVKAKPAARAAAKPLQPLALEQQVSVDFDSEDLALLRPPPMDHKPAGQESGRYATSPRAHTATPATYEARSIAPYGLPPNAVRTTASQNMFPMLTGRVSCLIGSGDRRNRDAGGCHNDPARVSRLPPPTESCFTGQLSRTAPASGLTSAARSDAISQCRCALFGFARNNNRSQNTFIRHAHHNQRRQPDRHV